MDIEFKNRTIRRVCEDASFAKKQHGSDMADKIHQRVDQIRAAESVEEMIKYKIGNCHQLKGNRSNQYAVDLVQPHRLIFEKIDSKIQIVRIIEIVNYH